MSRDHYRDAWRDGAGMHRTWPDRLQERDTERIHRIGVQADEQADPENALSKRCHDTGPAPHHWSGAGAGCICVGYCVLIGEVGRRRGEFVAGVPTKVYETVMPIWFSSYRLGLRDACASM